MHYEITYGFLFMGAIAMLVNFRLPKWYLGLMIFILLKWIFNYRKCTVSYLECVLRGVKRNDGYLYRFLENIVDIRGTYEFPLIFVVCCLLLIYHYIVQGNITIF